ncbi:MAG: hypothetical protein ABIV25_15910 [Paracoccaceae bacterium]
MKKERRWLKSVIAASAGMQIAMPWQRQARRRPSALKSTAPVGKNSAIAAH